MEDGICSQTGCLLSLPAITVVGMPVEDRFMPDDNIVVSRLRL